MRFFFSNWDTTQPTRSAARLSPRERKGLTKVSSPRKMPAVRTMKIPQFEFDYGSLLYVAFNFLLRAHA
jgi:hypothetical protein